MNIIDEKQYWNIWNKGYESAKKRFISKIINDIKELRENSSTNCTIFEDKIKEYEVLLKK